MPRGKAANPEAAVRAMLLNWLDDTNWDTRRLLLWLEGYGGMPSSVHGDEPYLWLLRGLPGKLKLRERFATRVAQLLDEKPDETRPGDFPDQVLYNLLMLAGGLAAPLELAAPLHAMLGRKALKGEWQAIELRQCLLHALIHNQQDNALHSTWLGLIQGENSPYLPKDAESAFKGIVHMPTGPKNIGHPDMDTVGSAVGLIVSQLEGAADKRPRLRSLIAYAGEHARDIPDLDRAWINQADKHDWPIWAVECCPSLCIDLGTTGTGTHNFLLWFYIQMCIPKDFQCDIHNTKCRGVVLHVVLDDKAKQFVETEAGPFEKARYEMPYQSERAMQGIAAHMMCEIKLRHPKNETVGNAAQRALGEVNSDSKVPCRSC